MRKINKVLITGASGFIGSNLLDYIIDETDWIVVGVDNLTTGNIRNIKPQIGNKRFSFEEMNVSQITSIREYDAIFHLAALPRIQPSFESVREHVDANLIETLFIIEKMIEEHWFPRLVFSGSSSIYGNPKEVPTSENESIKCMNPYAFQKYEVEKYLELLSRRYPLDYVVLRYFNPYGPRSFNPDNPFNPYSSVIGIFLNRLENDLPLTVTGDGSQRRDFIHVRDVASANVAAALSIRKHNQAYNIGQGETMSILELAQRISSKIEFIEMREGEADITHANIDKARQSLNWEPKHKVSEYLRHTVDAINLSRQ